MEKIGKLLEISDDDLAAMKHLVTFKGRTDHHANWPIATKEQFEELKRLDSLLGTLNEQERRALLS